MAVAWMLAETVAGEILAETVSGGDTSGDGGANEN